MICGNTNSADATIEDARPSTCTSVCPICGSSEELEEKKTNDEGAQAMIFEENGSAGVMSFSVGRATGAAEVDVGTADPTERPKQRDR